MHWDWVTSQLQLKPGKKKKSVVVFTNTQGADKLHLNDFLGNFWRCSYILLGNSEHTSGWKVFQDPDNKSIHPTTMFSILTWTPHHWVLFDDSHHSALPATTDIVECLGTSITNCIVLVTPGTKGSTSKPWKHGFPWKGCWEFIGDIPTFFLPEVVEGTHFPLPGVCFLGETFAPAGPKFASHGPGNLPRQTGVLSQWWDHDKFHKIMPSWIKHPNITQDWLSLIIPKTVVWGSLGSQSDLISSAQKCLELAKWKNSSRIRMPKQKICRC